jgi:hypothetical protein
VNAEHSASVGDDGELLAVAKQALDGDALKEIGGGGTGSSAGAIAFADVTPAESGACNSAAKEVRLKAAAEGFDFREFGHREGIGDWAPMGRTRSADQRIPRGAVMAEETEHLVAWLAERDVKCPVCEYSLRNLKQARCPECNAALELAVASPNLNMAPWFVAETSMALGAGFDGVVSVLMISALLIFPPPTPAAMRQVLVLVTLFLVLTLICVIGLMVGYRSRRRWAFWNRRRQWWTAAGVFLATALGHGVIGLGLVRWLK